MRPNSSPIQNMAAVSGVSAVTNSATGLTTASTSKSTSIVSFNTQALKADLNNQIQRDRSKKKLGRAEKATVPAYTSKILGFMHFLITPEGYFRGKYFNHPAVDFPIATRDSLLMFVEHISTAYKWTCGRGIKHLMKSTEILDFITDRANKSHPWYMEYWSASK